MKPEQVRQLAMFLPTDWGHVGPSIVRPGAAPPEGFEGTRAFNPNGGPAPSVKTPLRILGATSIATDLVLRLHFEQSDTAFVIVWVVALAGTSGDVPLREVSSSIWAMLLRRVSSDLLSQTVVTSTGVRLLID
ncbi:hypothetical protein JOE58_000343 [Curtobacterium luteum]|uniref:Uncharacterized protein n=1 Tax=Curtobacterium luteum TaxID=33881 RepID=A0A8H9G8E0_9MICO|nr:hypothetical protein [Curtobacterium luteum]MBM7801092.1 hypothetical protein [Curtobacterium luteum]NUU52460.1 hypothetical protein [Curtobacterium luteum]GGK96876.1 hypothetical protein GCM10009769_13810 [Curtobacterium luteum]